MDQLFEIYVMAGTGAMERADDVETVMRLRPKEIASSWWKSVTRLGIHPYASVHMKTLIDEEGTRQWLSGWAQKHDLRLQHVERLKRVEDGLRNVSALDLVIPGGGAAPDAWPVQRGLPGH
jgi:hypothetical protein